MCSVLLLSMTVILNLGQGIVMRPSENVLFTKLKQ